MNALRTITNFLTENAPAIFTGLAVAGTVGTVVCAVKDTPKALDCLDEAYDEKNVYFENDILYDSGESLTKKEVIKAAWKCYILTYVMASATIAFILAANYSHIRKETAMAAMATFFEQRYAEYKDKVVEITGSQDVDQNIENAIAKDHIRKDTSKLDIGRELSDGEILCYEPITDQCFISSKNEIVWAELTANKILQMEERVTLNQVLALFPDLDHDKVIGDKMGWYLDDSYYEFVGYNWGFYGRPWLEITPFCDDVDGQKLIILNFSIAPVREEAYDLDEMLDVKKKVESEMPLDHIKEELKKAGSQK
jgi:hypothetical protein